MLADLHSLNLKSVPSFLRTNDRLRPDLYVDRLWESSCWKAPPSSTPSTHASGLFNRSRMPRYGGGLRSLYSRGMVIALRVGRQVIPSLPRALHIVRFLTNDQMKRPWQLGQPRRRGVGLGNYAFQTSAISHQAPEALEKAKKLRAARIRTGVVWTNFDAIKTKSDNQLHYSSVSLQRKCVYLMSLIVTHIRGSDRILIISLPNKDAAARSLAYHWISSLWFNPSLIQRSDSYNAQESTSIRTTSYPECSTGATARCQ